MDPEKPKDGREYDIQKLKDAISQSKHAGQVYKGNLVIMERIGTKVIVRLQPQVS